MENGGIIWIFTRYTLPLTPNLFTQAGILKKSNLSERKGKEAGNKLYQQTILELACIKALKNQLLTLNLFSKFNSRMFESLSFSEGNVALPWKTLSSFTDSLEQNGFKRKTVYHFYRVWPSSSSAMLWRDRCFENV